MSDIDRFIEGPITDGDRNATERMWRKEFTSARRDGVTALQWSCLYTNGDREDVVRMLLDLGCNIEDEADVWWSRGWRALHFCASSGHRGAMLVLLEARCCLTALTANKETPLKIAEKRKYHDCAKMLMEAMQKRDIPKVSNRIIESIGSVGSGRSGKSALKTKEEDNNVSDNCDAAGNSNAADKSNTTGDINATSNNYAAGNNSANEYLLATFVRDAHKFVVVFGFKSLMTKPNVPSTHSILTHDGGYNLQVNIYPGGYSSYKGSYLSICYWVPKGEVPRNPRNISVLPRIWNQITKDPLNLPCIKPSKAVQSKVSHQQGKHKFISHKDLQSIAGLIVNDTVVLDFDIT